MPPIISAADCGVPEEVVSKLTAYLTYFNGLGGNAPKRFHLSVIRVHDRLFFQLNDVPPHYDITRRPVYVYAPGEPISQISCPADPTWP
jgi:hypothetical protein